MENKVMPVIKIGEHNEVVIPKDVRDQLGVKPGDLVQATFQPVVDVPYTDESLGPEARASLEAGLKDVEEGRTYGPFDSAQDLIKHLKTTPPESDA